MYVSSLPLLNSGRTDGQTDRQTDKIAISISRVSVLTRANKIKTIKIKIKKHTDTNTH